jgi:hypothetical protein
MSTNAAYEHHARCISDLSDRLAALNHQFADLQARQHAFKTASDFLGLLEQQIADSDQTRAWLDFLETVDLRDRYETTMGHPNHAIPTTGHCSI